MAKNNDIEAASSANKLELKSKGQFKTTTHKDRSAWFRESAAWPLREPSMDHLIGERSRVQARLPMHPQAANWQQVGPTNIGGRMTCVVCDPEDGDVIWAGAAGGGIWHSKDAGKTWENLWHDQESLNIGSLAIDPNNADVLFCGTGESNLSADSYPGVGLYRSENKGQTWELLSRASVTGLPARIGSISIDPFDSDHIVIGGIGHYFPNQPRTGGKGGLYHSFDGGLTWQRDVFISFFEYRCHQVLFHPTKQGVLYATVTEQGIKNGIWRSDDGGNNWKHLHNGMPSPDLIERTTLCISPSQPSSIYAISASKDGDVLGVFRSENNGDQWVAVDNGQLNGTRPLGSRTYDYENQMNYGNTIVVHPENPDHVICGGVDLHMTTDGGQNWKYLTFWESNRGNPDHAHADHHGLLMPPDKNGRVYDMNDGGMDVSDDGGLTWNNRSEGLAVTMYYDLDVAQNNSNFFGGGAQDNGTPITVTGGTGDHFDITSGDGGFMAFDPNNENHIYASIYNMNIFRFPPSQGRGFENVSPPELGHIKARMWMVYIAMNPNNPNQVFTGSYRIWRTDNDAKTWSPVSGFFQSQIVCIEVAKADSNIVYVGTANGAIHRSRDNGNSWSGDISSAAIPGIRINRIITKPTNADHVLVVVANFNVPHVFRSLDGGDNWRDVDRGMLPDIPHTSIAIPTNHPNDVFVSNHVGVFYSPNFGNTWQNLSGNLPNVNIVDLVYHDKDKALYAATYGRSVWNVKIL